MNMLMESFNANDNKNENIWNGCVHIQTHKKEVKLEMCSKLQVSRDDDLNLCDILNNGSNSRPFIFPIEFIPFKWKSLMIA